MKIKRLPEDLARKIAAGEVIERPASVVKELLENAIDAKSESIAVELTDGGIREIVVRDDGEGMGADDLRLCVERHATSKIATESDLDAIATLGFRGEALASIVQVARVRIVSRPRDGDAYEISVSGGQVDGPRPAARAPGTTVEVRDLFFNVPARARFLSSSRSEYFHASRVVHRLGLAFPRIGWTFVHNGKEVFTAPAAVDLRERIGQLYGHEVADALIPIAREDGEVRVTGLISPPDLKRGTRRDQLFCVNGRPVSDRGLSYILANAYQGLLRRGTYPLAVIRIELPPDEVDVNVHPRKEEIRFSDPRRVRDLLMRALSDALSSRYVVSSIVPETAAAPPPPKPRSKPGSAPLVREPSMELPLMDVQRITAQPREKVRVESDRRVIGQLQNTYLLVESPDGLEIVDQHIAHERILYEELKEQFAQGEVARQRFLLPVRIELPFEAAALIEGAREELARVGIVLDEFGGGTFILREYPALLAEEQSRYGFQEAIEKIAEILSHGEKAGDALFDHILAELACAAAIKAGDRLPLPEQQALVDRLSSMKNPYFCPHGRPIIFTLSRDELDRRFKRA